MTDAKEFSIAQGGILSGNHNNLFDIVPQYAGMIKGLNHFGIGVTGSIQNADKGFDSKQFRRAIQRRKMKANIIENTRNHKTKKEGGKNTLMPKPTKMITGFVEV